MMNKFLVFFIALFVFPVSAFALDDLSSFDDRVPLSEKLLRQYKNESPNVVFRDRVKDGRIGKYYAKLSGDLSFLTWKNKYEAVGESGSDKFSFKPLMGLDFAVGYRINQDWRIDGEIGYIGEYSESETEYYLDTEKTDFSLSAYYVIANVYYDLVYGLYAGLGAGLSVVDISADHSEVTGVDATNLSPMGAFIFGWTYLLDEKVDFDVRYKLALFSGGDLNIGGVNVDTGLIMDNSLSVGIMYHF